jgi:hypothetical protein
MLWTISPTTTESSLVAVRGDIASVEKAAYDGADKVIARYSAWGGDDHDLWDAQTVA